MTRRQLQKGRTRKYSHQSSLASFHANVGGAAYQPDFEEDEISIQDEDSEEEVLLQYNNRPSIEDEIVHLFESTSSSSDSGSNSSKNDEDTSEAYTVRSNAIIDDVDDDDVIISSLKKRQHASKRRQQLSKKKAKAATTACKTDANSAKKKRRKVRDEDYIPGGVSAKRRKSNSLDSIIDRKNRENDQGTSNGQGDENQKSKDKEWLGTGKSKCENNNTFGSLVVVPKTGALTLDSAFVGDTESSGATNPIVGGKRSARRTNDAPTETRLCRLEAAQSRVQANPQKASAVVAAHAELYVADYSVTSSAANLPAASIESRAKNLRADADTCSNVRPKESERNTVGIEEVDSCHTELASTLLAVEKNVNRKETKHKVGQLKEDNINDGRSVECFSWNEELVVEFPHGEKEAKKSVGICEFANTANGDCVVFESVVEVLLSTKSQELDNAKNVNNQKLEWTKATDSDETEKSEFVGIDEVKTSDVADTDFETNAEASKIASVRPISDEIFLNNDNILTEKDEGFNKHIEEVIRQNKDVEKQKSVPAPNSYKTREKEQNYEEAKVVLELAPKANAKDVVAYEHDDIVSDTYGLDHPSNVQTNLAALCVPCTVNDDGNGYGAKELVQDSLGFAASSLCNQKPGENQSSRVAVNENAVTSFDTRTANDDNIGYGVKESIKNTLGFSMSSLCNQVTIENHDSHVAVDKDEDRSHKTSAFDCGGLKFKVGNEELVKQTAKEQNLFEPIVDLNTRTEVAQGSGIDVDSNAEEDLITEVGNNVEQGSEIENVIDSKLEPNESVALLNMRIEDFETDKTNLPEFENNTRSGFGEVKAVSTEDECEMLVEDKNSVDRVLFNATAKVEEQDVLARSQEGKNSSLDATLLYYPSRPERVSNVKVDKDTSEEKVVLLAQEDESVNVETGVSNFNLLHYDEGHTTLQAGSEKAVKRSTKCHELNEVNNMEFSRTGLSVSAESDIHCARCSSPGPKNGIIVASCEGEILWSVERVLGRRVTKSGQIEYLTQWTGCHDPLQNTWEPQSNFSNKTQAFYWNKWHGIDLPRRGGRAQWLEGDKKLTSVESVPTKMEAIFEDAFTEVTSNDERNSNSELAVIDNHIVDHNQADSIDECNIGEGEVQETKEQDSSGKVFKQLSNTELSSTMFEPCVFSSQFDPARVIRSTSSTETRSTVEREDLSHTVVLNGLDHSGTSKLKIKTCPVCNRKLASYGFVMHVKKCLKYENWKCEFCHIEDVYTFSPALPCQGPSGPRTLCPDCGKQYALKMKSVKKKVAPNAETVKAITFGSTLLEVKESHQVTHLTDKFDESKPLDDNSTSPTQEVKRSDKMHSESEPLLNTRRSARVAAHTEHFTDDNESMEAAPKKRDEAIHLANDTPSAHEALQDNGPEVGAASSDGHIWSQREECALLVSALNNPHLLMGRGPGTWMLDPNDNQRSKLFSADQITNHWYNMLQRQGKSRSRTVAKTPGHFRATYVLSACIAAEDAAAKSVALVSSGWRCVHRDDFDTGPDSYPCEKVRREHPRENATTRMMWHRPTETTKLTSMLPNQDDTTPPITLDEAWAEHLLDLRNGIEIPNLVQDVPLPDVTPIETQKAQRENQHEKASSVTIWPRPTEITKPASMLPNQEVATLPIILDEAWTEHIPDLQIETESSSLSRNVPSLDATPLEADTKKTESIMETRDGSAESELEQKKTEKVEQRNDLDKTDDLEIPGHVVSLMKKRAQYCAEGDPRPSLNCSWCGPKWVRGGEFGKAACSNKVSEIPSCKSCLLLHSAGWTMLGVNQDTADHVTAKSSWMDYRYTSPDGTSFRSVKTFLSASTKSVVLLTGKLERRDDNPVEPEKTLSETSEEPNRTSRTESEADEEQGAVCTSSEELSICTEIEDTESAGAQFHSSPVPLPTIQQLLREEQGLFGALRADKLALWNTFHGSDSSIALKILGTLSTGDLPHLIQFETPFLRPVEDLATRDCLAGPPPVRFVGVTRIIESRQLPKTDEISRLNVARRKFGVECPLFTVDHDSDYECEKVDQIGLQRETHNCLKFPPTATVGGKKVLLRSDLAREDVAGQLYTFVYRVLYGSDATEQMLARTNASEERDSNIQDVLRSFNATRKQRASSFT